MATRLHVGMDDTDSARGMCTTFLAYVTARGLLERGAIFPDYPRLVRLNPNVPWKTRGNGAVSMVVDTDDPDGARRFVMDMVRRHSDMGNGASPGAAFLEGDSVPSAARQLAGSALRRVVGIREALDVARDAGMDVVRLGYGRGVIGAVAAIGYIFGDSTAELVAYRGESMLGERRLILPGSVRAMQEATRPDTFSSYDHSTGRVLIAPRGPDPVFYGIRGENPRVLRRAAAMLSHQERPRGSMIFRTNQGTGDHLNHPLESLEPHESGTVRGQILDHPRTIAGGHVSFSVSSRGGPLICWTYRPTGLGGVVRGLAPGDTVELGGGIRPESPPHPRALNVELVRVLDLAAPLHHANPRCDDCGKNMKSRGRGQGYGCVRCGATSNDTVTVPLPRSISVGEYAPRVSAHRHLTRPVQRNNRINQFGFDHTIPWLDGS